MAVVLHGYKYSVYQRIVRMTLAEKGVPYNRVEVNPFAEDMPEEYLSLHPFRRVPTLVHDDFVLYETVAITRYIDEAFSGPALQPSRPCNCARMAQIIAIIDSYGYWPMVRQVFSQRVFEARLGEKADEHEVVVGIEGSSRVLSALEALATEGIQLNGNDVSLADLHLAPIIACFTAAPEGQELLALHPNLTAWWDRISQRRSFRETDPGLPDWFAADEL